MHALQDQHFNLDSLTRARDDNDRLTTGQTVVEGQATLEQLGAMIGSDNAITSLPGGWDRVRQMIREIAGLDAGVRVGAYDPSGDADLSVPHRRGVHAAVQAGSEGRSRRSRACRRPPSSCCTPSGTSRRATTPRRVVLPAPLVGTAAYQNNLGEFETRILLFEYLKDQASAVRGAAGWDGDRYMLIETPRGDAIAWVTRLGHVG